MVRTYKAFGFIALLSFTQWLSCGELNPTSGTITFIPTSTEITFAGSGVGTTHITVNILDDTGAPLQAKTVKLLMPLHGREPFPGAASTVAFLDADGEEVTLDSPDGSSNEGTVLELTTDKNGNIDVDVQYPFGTDYSFEIIALAERTSALFSATLTQDFATPTPTATP